MQAVGFLLLPRCDASSVHFPFKFRASPCTLLLFHYHLDAMLLLFVSPLSLMPSRAVAFLLSPAQVRNKDTQLFSIPATPLMIESRTQSIH